MHRALCVRFGTPELPRGPPLWNAAGWMNVEQAETRQVADIKLEIMALPGSLVHALKWSFSLNLAQNLRRQRS